MGNLAVTARLFVALLVAVLLVAGCGGSEASIGSEAVGVATTDDGTSSESSDDSNDSPDAENSGQPDDEDEAGDPEYRDSLSTDPDIVFVAGTCHEPPSPNEEAVEVPCDEPHTIEVYAHRELEADEDAAFQGLDEALALCEEDFIRITGLGIGLATVFGRSVLRPSEETWADGERDVTCYVVYPSRITETLAEIDPVRGFGQVSIYGLEVGDCFVDFDETETNFEPLNCDEPHGAEVFIDFEYPPGDYPGDDAIDVKTEELCFGGSFEGFVGLDYETSAVFSVPSRPRQETWKLGDRTINCVLTDETIRTGSFEGSGV